LMPDDESRITNGCSISTFHFPLSAFRFPLSERVFSTAFAVELQWFDVVWWITGGGLSTAFAVELRRRL
ncbi:MAG: hypothetical protein ACLFTU_11395, partial [Puniceicoccaceae bacterium]